jgi:hypothetical protein
MTLVRSSKYTIICIVIRAPLLPAGAERGRFRASTRQIEDVNIKQASRRPDLMKFAWREREHSRYTSTREQRVGTRLVRVCIKAQEYNQCPTNNRIMANKMQST